MRWLVNFSAVSHKAAMKKHYIFGYGSLVNHATHDYENSKIATLRGWRRAWVSSAAQNAVFLSIVPDQNCTIDGLILPTPPVDPALDQRETAYDRVLVSPKIAPLVDTNSVVNTYAIPSERQITPMAGSVILRSYLDVVVQGYFQQLGEAGVQGFFDTTWGWDVDVLDDRNDPRYPRHQRLSKQESALTDHWLNSLSAQMK
ncbi:MAG: gamma-glutamylcyclotransferase family protein [Paracoccaceae bacterium]